MNILDIMNYHHVGFCSEKSSIIACRKYPCIQLKSELEWVQSSPLPGTHSLLVNHIRFEKCHVNLRREKWCEYRFSVNFFKLTTDQRILYLQVEPSIMTKLLKSLPRKLVYLCQL